MWILSLECQLDSVTAVIGPGEGECLQVQGVCGTRSKGVSPADDVRVASVGRWLGV